MTISSIDTWSVRVTKDTLVFSARTFYYIQSQHL